MFSDNVFICTTYEYWSLQGLFFFSPCEVYLCVGRYIHLSRIDNQLPQLCLYCM